MSIKGLNMIGPHYVCVLYVATCGLQGPLMGSDEQEIVLLIYVIVDVVQNKVVGVQQYPIRPQTADVNENVLSEQLTQESVLTDDLIKSTNRHLEDAINEFHTYCSTLHIDPHNSGFRFVTDGQLPLRQCLYPEAWRKDIELPPYYAHFYDLRKEVAKFTGKQDDPPHTIQQMVDYLQIKPEVENEFYKVEAKDMVNIVQRLIVEGHRFEVPETIQLTLEPGICSKDDEIDNNCVVRARGLPWQCGDQDIAKFFRGLNVAKGGVALCLSAQGRRNGEALVRFVSQEHRDIALKRHKHHFNHRYIEVYRATGEDFINVAGGASCEARAFLSRGASVIVRMRGLPYDCTAKQVLDFFSSGDNPCHVMDGVDGVLFVRKPDGRATGDAFVLFAEETDAPKALTKHRECIGSRYIELFRSTIAEVQQVLNRSMDTSKSYDPLPLLAQLPVPIAPLLPQRIITSGTSKDCIRLRGLPYEAQVEHILDFLGDHAKNIVFRGVHMVYNAQGQPSGEAFIQMDSEQSAFVAAQLKHHQYMTFGKKQRYIEVFQCSGEDMNLVLTGGLPQPGAVSPAAAAKAAAAAAAAQAAPSHAAQMAAAHAAIAAAAHSLLGPTAATTAGGNHQMGPPTGAATLTIGLPPMAPPHVQGPTPAQPAPPTFAPVQLAPSPDPRQFLPPPPILYWPCPSPPGSPTGYYAPPPGAMPAPPPQQIGQIGHHHPQMLGIHPEYLPLGQIAQMPALTADVMHRSDPDKTGQEMQHPCLELIII